MIQGIDVSHHQGVIDWDLAKLNSINFAFMRTSFGLAEVDKDTQFKRNWAEAKRVGIPRGAYHFLLSYQSITAQARWFVELMDGDFGELPPVCDVEYWKRSDGKYESNPTLAQIKQFCEKVKELTGKTSIIYAGGYWKGFASAKDASWALEYDHWLAQYTTLGSEIPCKPWTTWKFWQWSEKGAGALIGIKGNLDLDYFNGSLEDLEAYIGSEIPQEPTDPQPKRIKIIAPFLRGRSNPKYFEGTSAVIFEQGQILYLTDEDPVYEPASGITWIQVQIPDCPCCAKWISSNPKYIKEL